MYWARTDRPSRVALSSPSSVCIYLASSPGSCFLFESYHWVTGRRLTH